jgi:hypothetical protein
MKNPPDDEPKTVMMCENCLVSDGHVDIPGTICIRSYVDATGYLILWHRFCIAKSRLNKFSRSVKCGECFLFTGKEDEL